MAAKRFVILRHDCPDGYKPGVHWDLMLEDGGRLRTWALAAEPTAEVTIAAEQLPDHRLAYLDYEGPISGNRGVVSRWDFGSYELLNVAGDLQLSLIGRQLRGQVTLRRDPSNAVAWTFKLSPAST
jgi:hypothetical protein